MCLSFCFTFLFFLFEPVMHGESRLFPRGTWNAKLHDLHEPDTGLDGGLATVVASTSAKTEFPFGI